MTEEIDFSKLTPEQEKAVKALERALKKCRSSGVVISNNYGSLTFFDSAKTSGIGFDVTEYPMIDGFDGKRINQSGYDFDSFCDDEGMHYIQPPK